MPGTSGNDDFSGSATSETEIFCGFGGDDHFDTLEADTFFGGPGNDSVDNLSPVTG